MPSGWWLVHSVILREIAILLRVSLVCTIWSSAVRHLSCITITRRNGILQFTNKKSGFLCWYSAPWHVSIGCEPRQSQRRLLLLLRRQFWRLSHFPYGSRFRFDRPTTGRTMANFVRVPIETAVQLYEGYLWTLTFAGLCSFIAPLKEYICVMRLISLTKQHKWVICSFNKDSILFIILTICNLSLYTLQSLQIVEWMKCR